MKRSTFLKSLLGILILFISCEKEFVYVKDLELYGTLEIHNERVTGFLMLMTNESYGLQDTIIANKWFCKGEAESISLEEGVYRVELIPYIRKDKGPGSWSVPVFRDSTVVRVLE